MDFVGLGAARVRKKVFRVSARRSEGLRKIELLRGLSLGILGFGGLGVWGFGVRV